MKIKRPISLLLAVIFIASIFSLSTVQTSKAATTDKIVRVATSVWVGNGTKDQNLVNIGNILADAAKNNPNIVVLSEGIYSISNGKPFFETVPGPFTQFLSEKAKQYNMYIIANMYEDGGDGHRYNTDVLINKQGDIVGKYHKVRLPPSETQAPYSMTEGTQPAVYDTEYGKIGLEICYDIDLKFPEVTQATAASGADMIFVPSWGDYTHNAVQLARQNHVFMITSVRDHTWQDAYPDSAIIANDGTVINGIDNKTANKTCYADINLTQKTWTVPEQKMGPVAPPPIRTVIPFTKITASNSLPGTNPQSLADGSLDNIDAGPQKGKHPYWSSDKTKPTLVFDLGSLKKVGTIGVAQYDCFYQEDYFKLYISQDGKNYMEYTKGPYYKTQGIQDYNTGDTNFIKVQTATIFPGYKYIDINPLYEIRYIKIVGYGNSEYPNNVTNLTEVTAFEPLDPNAASTPFPDVFAPAAPNAYSVDDNDKVVGGKAEALATVYVKRGSLSIGTTKVKDNGSFIVSIPSQKAGTKLYITAKDAAGNISTATVVTVKDKTPPAAPTVYLIKKSSTTVTGKAEAGSLVTVKRGTVILKSAYAKSNGSFSLVIAAQKKGTVLSFTARDKAKNTSAIRKVVVM